MKITKLLSTVILFAFVLSSCSNNENLLPDEAEKSSLLNSYTLKRDATGAYYMDYETKKYAEVVKTKNHETNTNEIHLIESSVASSTRASEELLIDGNILNIKFTDANTVENPTIRIEDDNSSALKARAKNTQMLSEYSISSHTDGSYNLDFKVNTQVSADFVYNEANGVYEIHLEKGKSTATSFSKNLPKVAGKVLSIDFVNHTAASDSKRKAKPRRRPRVWINNGGYDW